MNQEPEVIINGYIVDIDGNIWQYVNATTVNSIGSIENGYMRINSRNPICKKVGTSLVHRIVIALFHPQFKDGTFDIRDRNIKIKHKNGDKLDNRYDNLIAYTDEAKPKHSKKWGFNLHTGTGVRSLNEVLEIEKISSYKGYKSGEIRDKGVKREKQ